MKVILLTKPEEEYNRVGRWLERSPSVSQLDIATVSPAQVSFSEYDFGVSYFYPHILKRRHWEALSRQVIINCHISYLPYNRGAKPAVFSIAKGTPAGVSIHVIDEGIDTGPILARAEVEKKPHDTGQWLYGELQDAMFRLLQEEWKTLCEYIFQFGASIATAYPGVIDQSDAGAMPTYRESSFQELRDLIDIDDESRRVLNIIRACSFPGGYAYTEIDGELVYLKLSLFPEE